MQRYIAALLRIDSKQYTSAKDFVERNWYFFNPLEPIRKPQIAENILEEEKGLVTSALRHFNALSENQWSNDSIKQALQSITMEVYHQNHGSQDAENGVLSKDLKDINRALYHWLRQAILGGYPGPGMPDSMVLLGRNHTLRRLYGASRNLCDSRKSQKGR